MFDRDLIISPGGGTSGKPGLPLEARPVEGDVGNYEGSGETWPATKWELEQAESVNSVGKAVRSTLAGIMVGGSAFATTVFLLIATLGGYMPFASEPVYAFVMLVLLCAILAFYIFMLSGLIGGLTIGAILIFNSVLKGALTRRSAIVLAGGIAAYLPCGLLVFGSVHRLGIVAAAWAQYLLLACFVFLAMLFGQIGAVWMANRSGVWRHLKQELLHRRARQFEPKHQQHQQHQQRQQHQPKGLADSSTPLSGFQFKIRHLMIGMIVCSCVLALDQLCTHHELLITVCLYLILQTLLLVSDWLYFSSYKKKLLGA